MSKKTKPCPFCGRSGVVIGEGSTFRWRVAECAGCGARCGEVRIQTSGDGDRAAWEEAGEVLALVEWNKRARAGGAE